jgi:hypothetical protein
MTEVGETVTPQRYHVGNRSNRSNGSVESEMGWGKIAHSGCFFPFSIGERVTLCDSQSVLFAGRMNQTLGLTPGRTTF